MGYVSTILGLWNGGCREIDVGLEIKNASSGPPFIQLTSKYIPFILFTLGKSAHVYIKCAHLLPKERLPEVSLVSTPKPISRISGLLFLTSSIMVCGLMGPLARTKNKFSTLAQPIQNGTNSPFTHLPLTPLPPSTLILKRRQQEVTDSSHWFIAFTFCWTTIARTSYSGSRERSLNCRATICYQEWSSFLFCSRDGQLLSSTYIFFLLGTPLGHFFSLP